MKAECFGHMDLVLGLQFVPHYNILITGDDSGDLRVWEVVRGFFQENIKCLDVISLDDQRLALPEWSRSQKGYGVRFLRVLESFETYKLSLVTVDYSGAFRVFDLAAYLNSLQKTPMPEESLPWCKLNYNPRKLLEVDMSYHHDHKGSSNIPEAEVHAIEQDDTHRLRLQKGWLIEQRDFSLITYTTAMELVLLSSSNGIFVHDSCGNRVGHLARLVNPAEGKPPEWMLPNTRQAREDRTREMAKRLLKAITTKRQHIMQLKPVLDSSVAGQFEKRAPGGKYHKLVRSLSVPKVSLNAANFRALQKRLQSPYRNYYHNYERETSHSCRDGLSPVEDSKPSAFLAQQLNSAGKLQKLQHTRKPPINSEAISPETHAQTSPSECEPISTLETVQEGKLAAINPQAKPRRHTDGIYSYSSLASERQVNHFKNTTKRQKQELLGVLDAIIDDKFKRHMYKKDARTSVRAQRQVTKRSKQHRGPMKMSRISAIKQHASRWRERSTLHVTNSHIGKFSKRTILLLKMDFDKLDLSKRGAITLEDLVNNMDSLTSDPPSLAAMNDIIDDDHNGEIDFRELLAMFLQGATSAELDEMLRFATLKPSLTNPAMKRRHMSAEVIREVKHLFSLYDKDNSGTISLQEILAGINETRSSPDAIGKVKMVTMEDLKRFCSHSPKPEMTLTEFTEFMRDMLHPHIDDAVDMEMHSFK